MIAVIIAGGSGTRLWPLSVPDYPKHLLRVNGDKRSLLQNTYDRARLIAGKVLVVPEISHAQHVKEQLPDLKEASFVVEPARRGTASCIAAALAQIKRQEFDENEPIAFLHADHFIRDTAGFTYSLQLAARMAKDKGRIVLIGVEPDSPATGFGYIQKNDLIDKDNMVFEVHSFKEKPGYELAKKYVKSGNYLWNCGYFVGTLATFRREMQEHAPTLHAAYKKLVAVTSPKEYERTYLSLDSDAIDYALIEKVPDLLVIPAAFDWMDLGSFNDMHKAVESDEQGNHVHGERVEIEGVENSFIQNHEAKPVAVIGLDNVVVINTPHGILVARKDLSQKVGDVSKRFKHAA